MKTFIGVRCCVALEFRAGTVLPRARVGTIKMRWRYAIVLGRTEDATHEDHIKAVATLEDVVRRCRRVLGLGTNNPMTANAECALAEARDLLSKS